MLMFPLALNVARRFCHTPSNCISAKSSPSRTQSIICKCKFSIPQVVLSQLSGFIFNFTSVATMSHMHCVNAFPSVLFQAFSTSNKVHHILGFAGKVMPYLVGKASVGALEVWAFLHPGAEHALPSSSSMLVSVASCWLQITTIRVRQFL